MNRRFVIIIVILVAAFLGIILFKGDKDSTSTTTNTELTSHVKGGADAKVTLTEFGDFQCPACAGYYPLVKEVQEKYGDQIKFQFRNFPLVSLHPNAMSAHRAAEAAGKQNKFWEMHDLLYERQNDWKDSSNPSQIFEQYADDLALNLDQYKADVADPAVKATIDADLAAGKELGVSGTPTFVLNGKKIDDTPRDVAGFSALIDELLNAETN